jgi:hypothetical protein
VAKNVLELNGKRYDAITGAFLGETSAIVAPAVKTTVKQPAQHTKGRVIDGFIRPTTTNAHITGPVKLKPAVAVTQVVRTAAPSAKIMHADPKKADIHKITTQDAPIKAATHATKPVAPVAEAKKETKQANAKTEPLEPKQKVTVNNAKAHQPQKAKTLMRRAVHKPETSLKPAIKPQAPAEIAPKSASAIAIKPSVLHVDEDRLERAHSVHKSKGIRHFQPVRPDYTPDAIESTPRPAVNIVPAIAVMAAPPRIEPVRHEDTDIFEAALARAQSHKELPHPLKKRKGTHRRLVNTMAGIAAFLVIGGFIGYLNMPNIQLRIASVQAGFTADMPTFKPDGYVLKGGVQRIGNTVSMRFTTGENNYTITQQPSAWNSQTLIDNTVALSDGSYKTVQAGGRNVYVYNGSNAVWVDRGIRYDLTANALLTTEDITQLAASL